MTNALQRGYTVTYTRKLVVEECITCHVDFGLPAEMQRWLRDHPDTTFYCPNGHSMVYGGPSDDEKARRRAEAAAAAARDQLHATERDLQTERRRSAAFKGQVTKARKRVGNGTCPCCRRHFPVLREHMRTQHPEFSDPGSPLSP